MPDRADSYRNAVKERLRAGQPLLGLGVRVCRSADIARIACGSGHDFLFIDTQHAVFDLETITHIAQAADALGIAPVVRARSLDDPDVPLLLDNGVAGIVFPDSPRLTRPGARSRSCAFRPSAGAPSRVGTRSSTTGPCRCPRRRAAWTRAPCSS